MHTHTCTRTYTHTYTYKHTRTKNKCMCTHTHRRPRRPCHIEERVLLYISRGSWDGFGDWLWNADEAKVWTDTQDVVDRIYVYIMHIFTGPKNSAIKSLGSFHHICTRLPVPACVSVCLCTCLPACHLSVCSPGWDLNNTLMNNPGWALSCRSVRVIAKRCVYH